MFPTTNLKSSIVSFLMLGLLFSCKNEPKTATTPTQDNAGTEEVEKQGQAFIEDDGSTPNVLQIAIGSPDHTTLVAAVQAAQLENVLGECRALNGICPNQ